MRQIIDWSENEEARKLRRYLASQAHIFSVRVVAEDLGIWTTCVSVNDTNEARWLAVMSAASRAERLPELWAALRLQLRCHQVSDVFGVEAELDSLISKAGLER